MFLRDLDVQVHRRYLITAAFEHAECAAQRRVGVYKTLGDLKVHLVQSDISRSQSHERYRCIQETGAGCSDV